YRISFTAKSSTWKYYVVAPSVSGPDLNILDNGGSAIGFSSTAIPVDDKAAPLLNSDPLKTVVLFTSDTPLVFTQAARKQIELRKNMTTLIGNLPNPDISKPTTEMFIYV